MQALFISASAGLAAKLSAWLSGVTHSIGKGRRWCERSGLKSWPLQGSGHGWSHQEENLFRSSLLPLPGGKEGAPAHCPPTSDPRLLREQVKLFSWSGEAKPIAAPGRLKSTLFRFCQATPNFNVFPKPPPSPPLLAPLNTATVGSEQHAGLLFSVWCLCATLELGFSPVHGLLLQGGSL